MNHRHRWCRRASGRRTIYVRESPVVMERGNISGIHLGKGMKYYIIPEEERAGG